MILGKVISRVVSSARSERLPAHALLCVQPEAGFGEVGLDGNPVPLIAIDAVQAGPGDRVLIVQEGTGAREALGGIQTPVPAQAVIVGVVDTVILG